LPERERKSRQLAKWDKIFANRLSGKELVPKHTKNFNSTITILKTN
jgi:hypothetical protein